MKHHAFEPLRPELADQLRDGDILVAGDNFGCGSSREMAAEVIKENGVRCIIAKSFARIFFRNAINIGLPIIECPEASRKISNGDEVEIDFHTGVIKDLTTGESFQGQAFPEFMQKIIAAEGLINYINSQK
jgi:3-isopropylmalate/(R)-2-methylmalate dehydratase small subunit